MSVFISVINWHSDEQLERCIVSAKKSSLHTHLHLTNNSAPSKADKLADSVQNNPINLGFCKPNNEAANLALSRGFKYFMMLNPDAELYPDCIEKLIYSIELDHSAAAASPLLLRDDKATIDSAGIVFTKTGRHFDRFSEEMLSVKTLTECYVPAGTGACLLIKLDLLDRYSLNSKLLDEAFFAYREDAELGLRIQRAGLRTKFIPSAIATHTRKVTPARRKSLPAIINAHSVKNRFLLQANHNLSSPQIKLRNTIVRLAVHLSELSSKPALRTSKMLTRRAATINNFLPPNKLHYSTLPSPTRKKAEKRELKTEVIVVSYYDTTSLEKFLNTGITCTVVDNTDEDKVSNEINGLCKKHNAKLIKPASNIGYGQAINLAVEQSDADLICFCNPDIQIYQKDIDTLRTYLLTHNNLSGVIPQLVSENGTPQHNFQLRKLPTPFYIALEHLGGFKLFRNTSFIRKQFYGNELPTIVQQPAGACIMFFKTCFDKLGGFDSRLVPAWFEDVDFCKRAWEQKMYIGLVPDVKIKHTGGTSLKTIGRSKFNELYARNSIEYTKIHHGTLNGLFVKVAATFGRRLKSLSLLSALLLLSSANIEAQDMEIFEADDFEAPAAESVENSEWSKTVSLGFSKQDGNTDTLTANASAKFTRDYNKNVWLLQADGNYGENKDQDDPVNGEITAKNFTALADYKRLVSKRIGLGINAKYETDDIADVDYRVTFGPGISYYIFKDTDLKLSLEAGPSYIFEKLGGDKNDYLAPRVGNKFEWAISDNAKIFQSSEVLFNVDDSEDTLVNAEAGIQAAITAGTALGIKVVNEYDNVPAAGRERNDLSIISSLIVTL